MLTVAQWVAECPLFSGLSPANLDLVAGCGRFVRFPAGATILRESQPADHFYVLREGTVALEVASPERGALLIQTLAPGDTLGWSWLFPPYRWHLDAVAREPVAATAFDATCLRAKCDSDHELGYQLMSRFAGIMLQRLTATRLQLLDVYAHGSR